MKSVDAAGGTRARGRAGAVGSLVDILAIDVDSVGDKGGTSVTAAGVALLKTEELQLGLDLVHERLAHCCGSVGDF